LESHFNEIAKKLNIDPVEFRRKNAIREGDTLAYGGKMNPNGLMEAIDRVAEAIEWDKDIESDDPNIAYGKVDASIREIEEAAKRAYAHEFISALPQGYDTVVGEQGVGLSGGQLQRIVIARAILKDPAILIFDEATSQVDADSESKIHNAIEEVMQNRTTFIIAHRFSTVISADVIVVMNDGRIVAQGQHDELIQTCRLYQSLYETQLVKA